jgi:CRISPR/Cas system endoribonuclease Cas6 (RAMP superfamily)
MSVLKSRLGFSKLSVSLVALEPCSLPEFTGSLLRGSFGHALKNSFCTTEDRKCSDCTTVENCGYFYIFESQDNSYKNLGYHYKPHPYIITPSFINHFKKGEHLNFEITFFGKFSNYLTHFIAAFQEMGKTGFGKDRNKFSLFSVKDCVDNLVIYTDKTIHKKSLSEMSLQSYASSSTATYLENLQIQFLTPARFAENGKVLKKISGKLLLDGIIRRYSSMHSFYGILHKDDLNIRGLEIKISTDQSSFKKWNRYSNRQERKVQQSGVIGTYTVENANVHLYELLKTMEILHVGKNTSFGLGQISLLL